MTVSVRTLVAPFALLALAACGGAPQPAANGPTDPSVSATGNGGAPADGANASTSAAAWTPYDDGEAGLHVELPCAKPHASVKTATAGPMQYTVKELACVVGSSRYAIEYWTSLTMTTNDMAVIQSSIEPVLMTWVDAPKRDGFTVTEKNPIKSAQGWTAFELRSTKGSETRTDRHFLLLPRHITMRATGPADDGPDHDRFNGSLKIGELGSIVGEAKEGMAERTTTFAGARFSMTLPCEPAFKPEESERTPDGTIKSRDFECHHPSANQGFIGAIGRFDPPLGGSAQSRRTKNAALALDNARQVCQGLSQQAPSAKCKVGTPKDYGTSGSEVTIDADGLGARVIMDHPYMGMLGVIAEMTPAERNKILSSLKLPTP